MLEAYNLFISQLQFVIVFFHYLLGLAVKNPANICFIFPVLEQDYFPGVDFLLPEQVADGLLILLLDGLGYLPLIFNLALKQLLYVLYLVQVEGKTLLL